MLTFAPLLADSLKGFSKNFLSFYVCKGVQASDLTPEGIKVIQGGKVDRARAAPKGGYDLSHLYYIYSGWVSGWGSAGMGGWGSTWVLCSRVTAVQDEPGFPLVAGCLWGGQNGCSCCLFLRRS